MKLRQSRPRRAAVNGATPPRLRWTAILTAVLVVGSLGLALAPGDPAAAAPADGHVRTFDDEPVGEPPADCRIIGDVSVAEAAFGGAAETNRAMRVVDSSNTEYTRAWCAYPQTPERSVSYTFSPAQIERGPYVAIQGAPGTSANGVWRFTFNRDGNDIRIDAYDGSSFAEVAKIDGGAALNEWVDVTINATVDRAELIVNGARFTTDRRNDESATMGEVYFGSAGFSPVGVDYYIDDLTVSGALPDDAFAGITVEPLFDDTGLARGAEVADAPFARFKLPEGADVADYTAHAEWRGETIPATVSGADADGWVTASMTYTFPTAGVGTLRAVITDPNEDQSVSSQRITIAGDFTALDFEQGAVGTIPPDCAPLDGYVSGAISDENASQGQHALRMNDTSDSAAVGISCTVLPQQGAYLSFHVNPRSLEGFTFDVIGDSLHSTGQPGNSLFRMGMREDGSVQWFEQWTDQWHEMAPAGTVSLDEWTHVEVAVPGDSAAARVSVDGAYVGSAGPTIGNNSTQHNEITGITGLAFTTGAAGAATVNDDVFVDDVTFGTPDSTPTAAIGTAPFHISDTTTIDDSGEQVGFPSVGVVVENDQGGKRILVPYSGHPDVDDAGGNFIGASDDGGASWSSGQDLNPMADTAGVTMTKLRNGSLLAVNFHTYMKEGTANRQAVVETSVSDDNGKTWMERTGTMESPEAMRPIGQSERPGTELGGFVVHHTVVEDPDGTLYMAAYGYYADDEGFRQIVLVSKDGGVDWSVAGTVAVADPEMADVQAYEGPCEGAIERLADGSLVMVMRVGWRLPMIYSRSTDNGLTWSEPKPIDVGPADQDLLSVQPTLELLPTGELLLLVGRPGLVMTISESGLGDDWSVPVGIDYVNTENGGFTVLDPTNIVVAGDRGRVAPWEVWSRQVTIDPPCEQTVTGAHDGPLKAGEGGLCLNGATVTGPISVSDGGKLIVQGSDITGPVTTRGASTVAICGSQIEGPVTATGSTGGVAVGDTTSGCDPSTITGPLSISDTSGPVVADRSEVTGKVTLTGSRSLQAPVLSGLTLHGPLFCSENTTAPTDSGVAMQGDGTRKGQCAE